MHYFSIPYMDLAYRRLSELLKILLLITSSRMIFCWWSCGLLCLGGSRPDIEPKETLTGQLSSNETRMRLKFASFPQISPRLFCQLVKSWYWSSTSSPKNQHLKQACKTLVNQILPSSNQPFREQPNCLSICCLCCWRLYVRTPVPCMINLEHILIIKVSNTNNTIDQLRPSSSSSSLSR